jgi:hypothetical protein
MATCCTARERSTARAARAPSCLHKASARDCLGLWALQFISFTAGWTLVPPAARHADADAAQPAGDGLQTRCGAGSGGKAGTCFPSAACPARPAGAFFLPGAGPRRGIRTPISIASWPAQLDVLVLQIAGTRISLNRFQRRSQRAFRLDGAHQRLIVIGQHMFGLGHALKLSSMIIRELRHHLIWAGLGWAGRSDAAPQGHFRLLVVCVCCDGTGGSAQLGIPLITRLTRAPLSCMVRWAAVVGASLCPPALAPPGQRSCGPCRTEPWPPCQVGPPEPASQPPHKAC